MVQLIDPINITDYKANKNKLEALILFWICAAGKNGVTSARCLYQLLSKWEISKNESPFKIIRRIISKADLAQEMKLFGIGCYNFKSRSFAYLVECGIDLKKCTVDDLEVVPGIGPKTARCFLIHSRRNQQYAGLDTHILKFLRDKGHEVPKTTPTGKKYKNLEKIFLKYVAESGKTVADFDLAIWRQYRSN